MKHCNVSFFIANGYLICKKNTVPLYLDTKLPAEVMDELIQSSCKHAKPDKQLLKEKESSILNDMLGHKTAEVAADNEKKVRQYTGRRRERQNESTLCLTLRMSYDR